MSKQNSSKQSQPFFQKLDRETVLERDLTQVNPGISARRALSGVFREIRAANAKRIKKIQKLRFLIYELQSIQPASLDDISSALGQSKVTTREQLDALIKIDLVVKTHFLEAGRKDDVILYCLNGMYNKIIQQALVNGLLTHHTY